MRCLVEGRVQGVFFRASTKQVADRLGLSGHAVNLDDGRVEVVACGDDNALEELRHFLKEGPQHASVTVISCEACDANPVNNGFRTG